MNSDIKYNQIIDSITDQNYDKAISMNILQDLNFDDLCMLYKRATSGEQTYNVKFNEMIAAVLKHLISQGYQISCQGIIDIIKDDHYGFLRTKKNQYFVSFDDLFLSSRKTRSYNIRHADYLHVLVNSHSSQDKRISIDTIVSINGMPTQEISKMNRRDFEQLTAEFPTEKFNLMSDTYQNTPIDLKMIDLFAPIGKGQRCLIVAPPRCGKTSLFMNLANAINNNHPETQIVVLLVDERPEEITEVKDLLGDRAIIFYSDFNASANKHMYITELATEYIKRQAELKRDVIIFIDSLTRIGRVINLLSNSHGKTLSGGMDALAMHKLKKGIVAKKIRKGGSITFVGTCLCDTGSKMDLVLFQEFNGFTSTLITLDAIKASKGLFPAIDIVNSGTRRCDLLTSNKLRHGADYMRRMISKDKHPDAFEMKILAMDSFKSPEAYLESMGFID